MDYHRTSSYRSHNLEVLGSSPSWSTLAEGVTRFVTPFFMP